jgi:hypothetical protein
MLVWLYILKSAGPMNSQLECCIYFIMSSMVGFQPRNIACFQL